MKKHYIDKGKSTFGIPQEVINAFDETVFAYSKKIYKFLINKFATEYIPLTAKGLIDIEKIYEIITKGAKAHELALTNTLTRILLSPKKAELDEIVFAYSQGIYRALVDSYNYPGGDETVNQYFREKSYHGSLNDPRRALLLDEGRKLLFYSNDKLDGDKISHKITKIISSKSVIPKARHYTEISESGYDTDDIEDYEVDEDNRILIDQESPLLIRYIESNMVIGAENLIEKTKVDVNTKDEYGRSALFYANSLDAITMLLGQGADVNIIDLFGNNVLHIWARKSLLTPMSHTCRDTIFGSFVDKLTIPQGEEEGPFSLINHKGQDVRYMFLLGSKYFHLSTEKSLPDIHDYNNLCSFVRDKISSPMKGTCNAYIPKTVLDIILSYLNMPINELSLEGVLSYYEKSKSSFDLSKIQNYGLPLLHRLALNTITNKPNDKNLELLKKLYELDPKQLTYASTMGNPLDIVLERSETIEAPELQKEFISFFLEKGGKISEKTKIGKLNKHLGIFQEHIAKIAQIVSSSGFFPKEINKIIVDYLPIYEVDEENNCSISSSSSCSSGSSYSFSSSLSSSSSFSCSSSSSESYSSISPLSGEESSIELYHQD
ncbi:MAG: hypothetical protein H6911_02555 [Rickettsiaceae bacterium]|nr:hypothetical protein [Rickettsiaceae bacterium]